MLRMLRWKLRFLRQRWECWCARRRSFQESDYSEYPVQDHADRGYALCKKSVEKALTAQNGVIRADADVDRGIARVFYENGVDDAKLQEAVEKEGFVVKNIETVV